jgi:hypothetical protein
MLEYSQNKYVFQHDTRVLDGFGPDSGSRTASGRRIPAESHGVNRTARRSSAPATLW